MIKKRKFPKIFFGWWTVITGGVLGILGNGYYTYAISALFKPMSAELGFNRAATSVAASIGRFEGGIESAMTGWITDKFGPRWIVLGGVLLMGLALILMYFVNSLWTYYVVWGVMLGTGFNIALTVPLRVAIGNWFVKKRGSAQGIQMALSGLSGVLLLPLLAWQITTQGWRMTCLIGGVVMWLVGLPLVWFFVKQRRPEYYGLLPDGAKVAEETAATKPMVERGVKYATEVAEVEFTLKQVMRTPTYWLLIAIQAGPNLVMSALILHAIPFLTDIGITPLVAASMVSIRVLAGLPMRFFGGWLADRVGTRQMRFIMSGSYFLQTVGTVIFLLHPTIAMIYVWYILYGLGQGGQIGIMSPMIGRYFGRKAYGSILGLQTALLAPAGIAAPIYFGWVYDTTGSYMSVFTLTAIVVGVAAVFAVFILPPKPPAEITDVRKFV